MGEELAVTNHVARCICHCATGDLVLDPAAWRATLAGEELLLTDMEFRLLLELTAHAGILLTYEDLLTRVWGSEYRRERNYLHEYVRNLRRKIEVAPYHPQHIINVRKHGYRFDPLPWLSAGPLPLLPKPSA